jgi:hypothetical protein
MTDEQQTELEERIAALEQREEALRQREVEAQLTSEERQGRQLLETIERDTGTDLRLPWKKGAGDAA